MGGKRPLKRKGGSPPTFPTQAQKIARQRPSSPSPTPSTVNSDSETISSLSDSSSCTLTSLSSASSTQTSMPSPSHTSTKHPNQTSVQPKTQTSVSPNNITSVPQTTRSDNLPTQTPTTPTLRPPPIMLNSASWRKIAPTIYSLPNLSPSSLSAKSSGEQVTLRAADATQFRLLQSTLLKHGTEFHTFSLPEERSLKVVLKGIPNDISTDELRVELESLGYSVKHARRFGTTEKPMPICVVHIADNPTAKDIFVLNSLFYLTISVEPLKPSGPAQCFSCQRFGHGSSNCGHPPRCVKCAGSHSANVCPKTRDQTPTCCNCGGPHTANFRGCPQFLAQKQQTQVTTQKSVQQKTLQPTRSTFPPPPPPPLPNHTQTYSTAISKPTQSPSTPPLPQLNLSVILNLLTNLLTALSNNQDPKTLIETTIKTFLSILSPQND